MGSALLETVIGGDPIENFCSTIRRFVLDPLKQSRSNQDTNEVAHDMLDVTEVLNSQLPSHEASTAQTHSHPPGEISLLAAGNGVFGQMEGADLPDRLALPGTFAVQDREADPAASAALYQQQKKHLSQSNPPMATSLCLGLHHSICC